MTGIVTLVADGELYEGWTTAGITRSITSLAGTFRLEVSDRAPGASSIAVPGAACVLMIDGEKVISGHVDAVRINYDSESHTIAVSGRDVTGDLADCSAASNPGEWTNQKLETIATALAAPFGIPVSVETDTGEPFRAFRIESGETVFESVTRMCRLRGVLPWSNGRGGLVIGRPVRGVSATMLKRGQNIISASGRAAEADRYSDYLVLAQQRGGDFIDGESAAHVAAFSADPAIQRYRPLTIVADQGVSQADAQVRADWEASVRAARSRKVNATVLGWRESEWGPLWTPGKLVRMSDDWLGIDSNLLISTVDHAVGPGGTLTTLTLAAPDAFDLQPGSDEPTIKGSDLWI